jgi:phosphatidate cytidylyltransferase
MVVLSALASYELVGLVGSKTTAQKHKFLNVALAGLAGLFFSLLLHNTLPFAKYGPWFFVFPFLGLVLLFILPDTIENRLAKSATFIFTLFYVVAPFALMQLLTHQTYEGFEYQHLLILFVLVWTNDTMAYVCGRLLGRHKMSPELSPKKTWEGFAGGIIFTCVAVVVIFLYFHWPVWNNVTPCAMAVSVSVGATIGDLFESAIKRWAGVKDSGNLIPGHGGILDRFDGAIFAVWPYFFIIQMYYS